MRHFPFYLALRNTLTRGERLSRHLLGSILGIGLSLIPLVVVLEVADGMIEGITRRYLELGTYHLQAVLPGYYGPEDYHGLVPALAQSEFIRQTIVEQQGMGLLYARKFRTGVTIRAIPPWLYRKDAQFRRFMTLVAGSFDLDSEQAIVLGSEVARRLQVSVGDRVKLLTIQSSGSPAVASGSNEQGGREPPAGGAAGRARSLPQVSSWRVTGIFSTGYGELDKLWTYISQDTADQILHKGNSTIFLGVKVNNPYRKLAEKTGRLSKLLPLEARLYTWYELEKANYKSFQTIKALLLLIVVLIVAVAAVNISSGLIMVVLEKTHEIGILKAIGARPRDIRLSFLLTGLFAGLAGSILGFIPGLLISVNINRWMKGLENVVNSLYKGLNLLLYPLTGAQLIRPIKLFNTAFYLEEIPIRLQLAELVLVAALTLLLSVVAAYLPARSAGRIKPLEVLRKY